MPRVMSDVQKVGVACGKAKAPVAEKPIKKESIPSKPAKKRK